MRASLAEPDHQWTRALTPAAIACGAERMEPTTVVLQVRIAQDFLGKARGLLGRPLPAPGCGLLLPGVTTVHGFGMRHCIDLLFLDGQGVIVRVASLGPASIIRCRGARHVLEMRDAESGRLGLCPGMRPFLVLLDDIFQSEAGRSSNHEAVDALHLESVDALHHGWVDAPHRRSVDLPGVISGDAICAGSGQIRRSQIGRSGHRVRLSTIVFACLITGVLPSRGSFAAPPDVLSAVEPGRTARPVRPAVSAPPVSDQLLKLLEEEAEALYREGGRESDDGELIEAYEALAELAADRSPHAWLRIGNIRQRSGSIGEAIDAYRRVRAPADEGKGAPGTVASGPAVKGAAAQSAGAPKPAGSRESDVAAERKALLNLTALALEQARLALARLDALPVNSDPGSSGGNPKPAASAPGSERSAVAAFHRQLESAERNLEEQRARNAAPSAQGLAGAPSAQGPARAPYGTQVVERYTASARRNAVTSARGSLHVHPDDELPAMPVARPRSQTPREYLPSVEYLLGDPLRSRQQKGAEGEGGNAPAAGNSGRAAAAAGATRKQETGAGARSEDSPRDETRK